MLSLLKKIFGGSQAPAQPSSTVVETMTTVVENKVEEAPAVAPVATPAKKAPKAKAPAKAKPAVTTTAKPKAAAKPRKPKAPKA